MCVGSDATVDDLWIICLVRGRGIKVIKISTHMLHSVGLSRVCCVACSRGASDRPSFPLGFLVISRNFTHVTLI